MSFNIGDKVVKNPATWHPSDFDNWGAGEGIGEVLEIFGDGIVDVRWENGRAYQKNQELLLATTEQIIGDAKVVFGLEAQGHIPIIQKMLQENKTWDEIGQAIGWCQSTARLYYERYFWRNSEEVIKKQDVLPVLAECIGLLEQHVKTLKNSWETQPIHSVILHARKFLASSPAQTWDKND